MAAEGVKATTLITKDPAQFLQLCHMSYDCEQVRRSLRSSCSSVSTGNTALPFQEAI